MGLYFQKSCGALQQGECLRDSNAPGFNGHVPESNKSANETCWRSQKIFREKLGTDFCAWGRSGVVL